MEGNADAVAELEQASEAVAGLEQLHPVARAAMPNFEALVTTAEANRDRLVVVRRASKPLQWRFVEAERVVVDEEVKALATLEDHLMDLRADMADRSKLLLVARAALVEAERKVASIRSEIGGGSMPDAAVAVLGLSAQLSALPAAVTAGNSSVALEAVQRQLAAIWSALGADKDTATGVAAAAAAVAGAAGGRGGGGQPTATVCSSCARASCPTSSSGHRVRPGAGRNGQ